MWANTAGNTWLSSNENQLLNAPLSPLLKAGAEGCDAKGPLVQRGLARQSRDWGIVTTPPSRRWRATSPCTGEAETPLRPCRGTSPQGEASPVPLPPAFMRGVPSPQTGRGEQKHNGYRTPPVTACGRRQPPLKSGGPGEPFPVKVGVCPVESIGFHF